MHHQRPVGHGRTKVPRMHQGAQGAVVPSWVLAAFLSPTSQGSEGPELRGERKSSFPCPRRGWDAEGSVRSKGLCRSPGRGAVPHSCLSLQLHLPHSHPRLGCESRTVW